MSVTAVYDRCDNKGDKHYNKYNMHIGVHLFIQKSNFNCDNSFK